jgi:hypothetical protein
MKFPERFFATLRMTKKEWESTFVILNEVKDLSESGI